MAERHSDLEGVDQPEPEEVLSGGGERTPDHEPSDLDDREVILDDPEDLEPPVDEEDRDPDSEERTTPD